MSDDGRAVRFSCSVVVNGNNNIFDKEGVYKDFISYSKNKGYILSDRSIIIENWKKFKNKKEYDSFKGLDK